MPWKAASIFGGDRPQPDSRGTLISFFVVPKAALSGEHLVYGKGTQSGAHAVAVLVVS